MMQWICLAKRPLSVTELRFAMASDCLHTDELQEYCKDARDFVETDERMERLITTLSGGLAEVKHYEGEEDWKPNKVTTIQFVHQSVNDFLLSDGLRFLASVSQWNISAHDSGPWINQSNDNVLGQSQHRLSRSCVNYLRLGEVVSSVKNINLEENMYTINKRDRLVIQGLPFIEYATRSLFSHAEKAESLGALQQDLIQQFNPPPERMFKNWVSIYTILAKNHPKRPVSNSTLLHVASCFNLQSIVQVLFKKRCTD